MREAAEEEEDDDEIITRALALNGDDGQSAGLFFLTSEPILKTFTS